MGQEIINLGTTAAAASGSQFDRTTKTLTEFLRAIARPITSSGEYEEVGALDAFHMALDWLVNDHDWEFYYGETDFSSVAGTADYVLPTRLKSVFSLRDLTNLVPLLPYRKNLYDRVVGDQTSTSTPLFYSMQKAHASSVVTLLPTPDAIYSYRLAYLAAPEKIANTGDVPNVADWMEEALILRAQGLVTKWRGGHGLLANDLLEMAEAAKRAAMTRDHKHLDEDERLVPFSEHGVRLRSDEDTREWWW